MNRNPFLDHYNEPLAPWERDLLGLREGEAHVIFTLQNGEKLRFDNVRMDSVGPSAENRGVIGVEFARDLDRLVHVPFVAYWEFVYDPA